MRCSVSAQVGAGLLLRQRRRVHRAADHLAVRVGDLRHLQRQRPQVVHRWHREMRQPPHVRPGRLVAQHQRVRLSAMDQRHGHPGIRDMEQRALSLDDVPVIGVVVRRQVFDRPRHEIGDHRVQRHSVAGHQDARLPGRPEARLHPARQHVPLHRQRRVHLAAGAVGADRQQAFAGPLLAVRDRILDRRDADIVQGRPRPLGGFDQVRLAVQQRVQTRGNIHAGLHRLDQDRLPGIRDDAAAVRDPDDQRLGALRRRFGDTHVGQAHVGLAPRQTDLADRGVGTPVLDPLRHLGGQLVGRIAQEQQIGLRERHGCLPRIVQTSGR